MGANRHHIRISGRQADRLRAIAGGGVITIFWTVFILLAVSGPLPQ